MFDVTDVEKVIVNFVNFSKFTLGNFEEFWKNSFAYPILVAWVIWYMSLRWTNQFILINKSVLFGSLWE